MRHRRCRRMVLSTFHGFALWASPAVTHGVSPLGTVGEHVEAFRLPPPCISCIVCRPSHHLSSSAASTQRYSRLWRCRTASIEQPHKSTLASGGGAPCLTAGDARRVNPWRRGQRELRRRRRRTASVEGASLLPLIVISATISAPADAISLSAHTLIVFENTIRISTLTFLISTHLLQKKLKKSSEDSEDFQHFGVIYSNVQDFLYTNDTDG